MKPSLAPPSPTPRPPAPPALLRYDAPCVLGLLLAALLAWASRESGALSASRADAVSVLRPCLDADSAREEGVASGAWSPELERAAWARCGAAE